MAFDGDGDLYTAERRIVTGLNKIGLALRSMMWAKGQSSGLTPTQGQILTLLQGRGALRLSAIAGDLGVRQPTTTEAVNTLVRKGLVDKAVDPDDGRAILLKLTEKGRAAVRRIATWPDAMTRAAAELDSSEQASLLRALMKLLRALHLNDDIAAVRMCASCGFFRPHDHGDKKATHHCDFFKASFSDQDLRLDCVEHKAASDSHAHDIWRRFATGMGGTPESKSSRT